MISEEKFNTLCSDVEVIKNQVSGFMVNTTEKQGDHEKRLRFLEKYAFLLIGGIGLAFFVLDRVFK